MKLHWFGECFVLQDLSTSGLPLSNRLQKVFLCLLTLFGLGESEKLRKNCAKVSSLESPGCFIEQDGRVTSPGGTIISRRSQTCPQQPQGPTRKLKTDVKSKTRHDDNQKTQSDPVVI